jgi:hypothetical protein
MFVSISMIIVWEVCVFLFALLFGTINVSFIKKRKVEIQLYLAIFMFVVTVLDFFIAKYYEVTRLYENAWDRPWYEETGLIKIYVVWFAMVLGGSIYKYKNYKKGTEVEEVFLKKDDYVLHKDFDLNLNDYIYMPNVKSYATYGKDIILFSGESPSREEDALFMLKNIKDNYYECISYYSKQKDVSIIDIFSRISSWMLYISSSVFVVAVHVLLSVIGSTYADAITLLTQSCGMFMFGSIIIKLFKGTKSIISIIEIVVGAFAIFASIKYFIDFIALVL